MSHASRAPGHPSAVLGQDLRAALTPGPEVQRSMLDAARRTAVSPWKVGWTPEANRRRRGWMRRAEAVHADQDPGRLTLELVAAIPAGKRIVRQWLDDAAAHRTVVRASAELALTYIGHAAEQRPQRGDGHGGFTMVRLVEKPLVAGKGP